MQRILETLKHFRGGYTLLNKLNREKVGSEVVCNG